MMYPLDPLSVVLVVKGRITNFQPNLAIDKWECIIGSGSEVEVLLSTYYVWIKLTGEFSSKLGSFFHYFS